MLTDVSAGHQDTSQVPISVQLLEYKLRQEKNSMLHNSHKLAKEIKYKCITNTTFIIWQLCINISSLDI